MDSDVMQLSTMILSVGVGATIRSGRNERKIMSLVAAWRKNDQQIAKI